MRARSTDEEDYVLRIIRQAAEALRVLREMLLRGADSPEVVRARAAVTIGALLGDRAGIAELMDATTAVRLVGDERRVALWASLVELQGEATTTIDPALSARLLARAAALREASARVFGGD